MVENNTKLPNKTTKIKKPIKVFSSWSGGKDCCLALHRVLKDGADVRYLANMISADGKRSKSHGIKAEIIKTQARAMGIPIVQQPTKDGKYENSFRTMLRRFKGEGITGGIFGDIDFNEHREWIERVCGSEEINPYLPLWLEDQDKLLGEFIEAGFKTIIIATQDKLLGEKWLGRVLDEESLSELKEISKNSELTVCGEAGEYHTLVIDGPIFKKRLEITKKNNVLKDGRWFLEIVEIALI